MSQLLGETVVKNNGTESDFGTRYAPHTHAPLMVCEDYFREGFALFRDGGGPVEGTERSRLSESAEEALCVPKKPLSMITG